jgi:hypothetical protein
MAEDTPPTPRRQHGHSRSYIIDRLKRENQTELASAVEAGTLSAFSAAVQLGWTKRPPAAGGSNTHQARKRRIRLQAITDGDLSSSQKMELQYGPNPTQGSLFSSREQLESAWAACRDELLARANPGHRPAIWWELEASGLRLQWPGYFNERSYLYKANVLSEAERAELEHEWKVEFAKAQAPGFMVSVSDSQILKGAAARAAHYRWADIPSTLIEQWSAEYPVRRRGRKRTESALPGSEVPLSEVR